MSDDTHRKPVRIAPPHRLRASWFRQSAQWVVLAIGACTLAMGAYALIIANRNREPDCDAAIDSKRWALAVEVCRYEFWRTLDATAGMHLADALRATNDIPAAKRVAMVLRMTPRQSDAYQVLGDIAFFEDNIEEAISAFEEALILHRSQGAHRGVVHDSGMLASIRSNLGQFDHALRSLDECLKGALQANDASLEHYCRLTASRTLIRVGHLVAARGEIMRAMQLTDGHRERRDLNYQLGNLIQESAQDCKDHLDAITCFNYALEHNLREPTSDKSWVSKTKLNIAYSLAECERFPEAEHHLNIARIVDPDRLVEPSSLWTAAQIAYRRGDLAHATSLTDAYLKLPDGSANCTEPDEVEEPDEWIEVATLRVRIELAKDDLRSAECWARRAVKQAENVRNAQSGLELRRWVLAKRRAPYELLFSVLARSGQVEAAAMVFDQWQGQIMQDNLSAPRLPHASDLRSVAMQFQALAPSLHEIARGTLAKSADKDAVLRTMHSIDLLALIVANDEVWRLTASHGPPRILRIGAWSTDVGPLVEQFLQNATDVERASTLAARLVPGDMFTSSEVLHVVLYGRLGALPVAALRHNNVPLVTIRPIVRALRLPEIPCAPAIPHGSATVLAYPDDSLPNTLIEAAVVATHLSSSRKVDVDATKHSLFNAASDALLHVAAHSSIEHGGGAIKLRDGDVSAQEIWARRVAPSLAVLATCSSADAPDEELAVSLASAFLAAGSQRVIATVQSVTDRGALRVMSQFYAATPLADPARALATAQAKLAETDNTDWPYFVMFGPGVCRDGGPTHP